MAKEAVLFPGQGLSAQEIIGFYEKLQKSVDVNLLKKHLSLTQEIMDRVHGRSEFSILSSLADETSPSFGQTAFVQPTIYSLSVISYQLSDQRPDFVSGHSLGEYSAMTAAAAIEVVEGIELVVYRGKFMQEVCDGTPSRLISLQGLTEETVKGICRQDGVAIAEVALINALDLIVVGCAAESVHDVEDRAKAAGASKATLLNTAGAFHTSFMADAAKKLETVMPILRQPKIPFVANLTGELVENGQFSGDFLIRSMTNPVQWAKELKTLETLGVQTFCEIGPGRSLASLNRLNGFSKDQTRNILD